MFRLTELDVWDLSTAQSREAKTNVGNTCEHIRARATEQSVTRQERLITRTRIERGDGFVACLP